MSFVLEKIEPRFVERVWGSQHLEPWFPSRAERVGEVWYDAGPLLIKFLFTTEALSVQVHPDDEYAAKHNSSAGKTEMWHILEAKPGARIALGFREKFSAEKVAKAAVDGTIEELLAWHEGVTGDSYFVEAGAVHALGAGLVVCEVQQTSDITYRLFDYGRGRELHLEDGMKVAELCPHSGKSPPVPLGEGIDLLVECEYFRVERRTSREPFTASRRTIMVVLSGSGRANGLPYERAQVWKLPENTQVQPDGESAILLVYARGL